MTENSRKFDYSEGSPMIDNLDTEDLYTRIELGKPRLFSRQSEVIKKTGIGRNLIFLFLFGLTVLVLLNLPILDHISDPCAVLAPVRRLDFASPKDGFVAGVYFKEGEAAKKGELVLSIRSGAEDAARAALKFEAASWAEELKANQAEAKILDLKLDDARYLHQMGSLKQSTLDEALLSVQAKRKRIRSLALKRAQTLVRRSHTETMIKEGEIRAPFDGKLISDPLLHEKSFVREGDFLLTFASEGSYLEFTLKESDYEKISAGARATIRFYAFPKQLCRGKVVGFKHFAEAGPKTFVSKQVIKALIEPEHLPARLQNGMSAKVSIETKPESIWGRLSHELF